ncbi:ketopantoate reductase family protein [Cohnella sp. CFH 77786]|uniref:ketopantoate reductase family protein n=1 Tax=Cohnella sp. CFH 77786 TaxID=2662265 RepID=UPI001C60CD72|nr:2-dehydropantoate 2-reductase [Cohnella sp. CFH 77786]
MHRLAVMGGGSLGLLLAGKLAAAGLPAELWTRTEEQAARIAESGLTLEERDGSVAVRRIEAVPFEEVTPGFDGIVLIALKQTSMDGRLLRTLGRKLGMNAGTVLFQNGIGHVERVSGALPGRRLLAAVTTEAALRSGPSSVRHTGSGETWIGEWEPLSAASDKNGMADLISGVEQALKKAGFSASVSNEIRERMLRKLLINAVVNPLTALWRVPNGELTATPERRLAMDALFRETAGVLRQNGLHGAKDSELWEDVLRVCRATAANRSSMLQDVTAGRETEIDALNGAVCRMAAASGRDAPWNAAVTALVKAIQSPKERGV